jgi:AcrR family transcriptional regulator
VAAPGRDRPREFARQRWSVWKGVRRGPAGRIAKRAGVEGALYLYFEDKKQLFRAVVRHCRAQRRLFRRPHQAGLPFADLIRLFLVQFVEMTNRVPVRSPRWSSAIPQFSGAGEGLADEVVSRAGISPR